MKLIYLICLTVLASISFAQKRLPTDEETLIIVQKNLNYPGKVVKSTMWPIGVSFESNITLGSQIFKLKTNTYYKDLVDKNVLKVISQNENTYTYEIIGSYKKNIISIDKKNFTAKVKTVTLEGIRVFDLPTYTSSNEAAFGLQINLSYSSFYNSIKYPTGVDQPLLINNIKLVFASGIWKLKDPVSLKEQIKTYRGL